MKDLKLDELHVLQPGSYSTPCAVQPTLATHPRILWNPCPFTHALSQNKPHGGAVTVMVKSFDTEILQSSSDWSTDVCWTQTKF